MKLEPGTVITAHQSDLFAIIACNHEDCSYNLPSVPLYLRLSRASHLPALIDTVNDPEEGRAWSLWQTLPLHSTLLPSQSLISSTIRAARQTLSLPTVRRRRSGSFRFPCDSRGLPQPVYFHGSPEVLSYTYRRVVPAHVRLPQVVPRRCSGPFQGGSVLRLPILYSAIL